MANAQILPFPSNPHPAEAVPEPEPRLRDVIGDVLREERTDQRRTLADVAERAAVSLPYLSEIERGRKEPSSDVVAAICDALELPLPDLLDRAARRLRLSGTARSGMFALAA